MKLPAWLLTELHWSVRLVMPVAILVGGYLLLHATGGIEGLFSKSTEAAISGAQTELHTTRTFEQQQRQLQAKADAQHRTVLALTTDTARLRAQRDTAFAQLARFALTVDSAQRGAFQRAIVVAGQACRQQTDNCEARRIAAENETTIQRARADAADARAAHADSLTKPLLHAADCRWLGVSFLPKCLSRIQSVEAGFLGAVLTHFAFHIP